VKFPKWSQWFITTADPPMTVTGHLPRPLGRSAPIKADWYDICNMDTPEFMKLHQQALATPFKERTASMRVVIHRMTTQARSANVSLITTLPTMPVDTLDLLKGWQLNPHGVPPAVRQELDGTMNLHDVDIWMWLQKVTPKKNSSGFRKSLWALFQQPGRWFQWVSNLRIPLTAGDTFRTSVTKAYDWGDRHPKDHSEQELALWLLQHGGINITRASLLEVFAKRVTSGVACNHSARLGKCKQGALGASAVTQGAAKHSLVERIQRQQLDSDLDKATVAAVTVLSSIVVDDPMFPDEVVESHPSPAPYDLDDHMDTDS
jgi:hypothetical protein